MLENSPLGQKTTYIETYSPSLLYPISRNLGRDKVGLTADLPFDGFDLWTGYEISWLDRSGKPVIAKGKFFFPCTSLSIIESKSFKLYLNSFNQSKFNSLDEVVDLMKKDLSAACGKNIRLELVDLSQNDQELLKALPGKCIDHEEISTDTYLPVPETLKTIPEIVEETLTSNLLKSNCLATGQPDWGSLQIHYSGPKIDRKALLKYIISYRRHSGFAEHCTEQMFQDIMQHCKPQKLSVTCSYTRRGGLDITPFRSNFENSPNISRHVRQ